MKQKEILKRNIATAYLVNQVTNLRASKSYLNYNEEEKVRMRSNLADMYLTDLGYELVESRLSVVNNVNMTGNVYPSIIRKSDLTLYTVKEGRIYIQEYKIKKNK
nr:MAG TPA: hypothetical protein [Microviridae sp.]